MSTVRLIVAQALVRFLATVPGPAPETTAWWDVPVAEVSRDPVTRAARERYEDARRDRRPYL
ncbi:hypothetical protein ACFYSC_04820 [Streptosporangium sp. NPDC004379]|uniref:hypothetical protein n=1 Tax=Streptosporangium sp. NPDC004379 TaxID=3366189 RepID=UPI0036CEB71B